MGVLIDAGAASNVIGGTSASYRNVISGNDGGGIRIAGATTGGTLVQSNYIGTDATGAANLGNNSFGIYIDGAPGNTVGGSTAVANLIRGNLGDGVQIVGNSAVNNRVWANSIYENQGLGINLGLDAVTANDTGDADVGGNNLQNFPVLSSPAGGSTINWTLNSTLSATYTLDFYANAAADSPSGYGEGQTYLGRVSGVTTDVSGDAAGVFSFTAQPGQPFITATATDSSGSTSEFSLAVGTTVYWDGDSDGDGDGVTWTDPLNWSNDLVPGAGDNVVIDDPDPNPITVVVPVSTTIGSLTSLESLQILSGTFIVRGPSTIQGDLTLADRVSLRVDGATAALTVQGQTLANGASLYAVNGGVLTLPGLTSYHGGTTAGYRYLYAYGAGSVLDLPNLTTITENQANYAIVVQAYFGAEVRLPKMATPNAQLQVESHGAGSLIDLSSLTTWDGFGVTGGSSFLEARNGGSILIPSLSQLTRRGVARARRQPGGDQPGDEHYRRDAAGVWRASGERDVRPADRHYGV